MHIVDLFAGTGALSSGFKKLVNEPYCTYIEQNRSACETILYNHLRQFDEKFSAQNLQIVRSGLRMMPTQSLKSFSISKASIYELELSDKNDVRTLLADEICKSGSTQTGPRIVVGGPPCQAYSLIGRSKNKSLVSYEAALDHRHYLYREYLKSLVAFEPDVFVFENVKGLLTSKVNDRIIFRDILAELHSPGRNTDLRNKGIKYRLYSLTNPDAVVSTDNDVKEIELKSFLVDCSQYGMRQKRERIFVIGVRSDILLRPDVLGDLGNFTQASHNRKLNKLRGKFSDKRYEVDWLASRSRQFNDLINRSSSLGLHTLSQHLEKAWSSFKKTDFAEADPYINHNVRRHMFEDIARYTLLAAAAVVPNDLSNKQLINAFELEPKHMSWSTSNSFSDRFSVVPELGKCQTITSHISKDGHYYIHHDPIQGRSLSVREAARIQGYDDEFKFMGNITSQYTQVGNAVPPTISELIANCCRKILK